MKKPSSLPILALIAVVALVLGSFGTAVAGPAITKGKVKSIATKVVKKQAPSLSVAHAVSADTATNATNLNGQPASAYQTPGYTYLWPTTAAFGNTTKTIPAIPAGNYVVNVDFIANTTDGTKPVFCWLFQGANNLGSANGSTFGPLATVSFSRIVTVTAATMSLNCQTNGGALLSTPYGAGGFGLSSVSFTKVDSLTSGTLTKGTDGKASANGAPAGN